MIVMWIIGAATAIGIGLLNYRFLKLNSKITHYHYAFNHSTGLISFYAFLYFALLVTLILLVEDREFDEDDEIMFGTFELKYRQRAWAYFLIELVYFSGFFCKLLENITFSNRFKQNAINIFHNRSDGNLFF